MATSLPWHPFLSSKPQLSFRSSTNKQFAYSPRPNSIKVQAFGRSDFDGFAKRMASGEAWRDAWRSANNGFEQLLYETKKTAERIDRRYSIGNRLLAVAQSASHRARELDRDFSITQRWRTYSLDFVRNLPRYRKQLSDFLDTPLGRSFAEAELGRKLTQLEFFGRVHRKEKGAGDWCDQRAKNAADQYQTKITEKRLTQFDPVADEGSSSQPSFDPEAWAEAVGGPKKNYIYGFGLTQRAEELHGLFEIH